MIDEIPILAVENMRELADCAALKKLGSSEKIPQRSGRMPFMKGNGILVKLQVRKQQKKRR